MWLIKTETMKDFPTGWRPQMPLKLTKTLSADTLIPKKRQTDMLTLAL